MRDQRPHRHARWAPEPFQLRHADLRLDRVVRAFPAASISQGLLGYVSPVQHAVAAFVFLKALQSRGIEARLSRHDTGLAIVDAGRGTTCSPGFVVATQSSMEPRHGWPMLLPDAVLEATDVQWIGACSVPKMTTLEGLAEQPAWVSVIGWMPIANALPLKRVTLEPHIDHPFRAGYRQALNRQLSALDGFDPRSG